MREKRKEGMTEEIISMNRHFLYMPSGVEDLSVLGIEEPCASLDEK